MTSINWPAIIAAICAVGGSLSIVLGHPAMAAIFGDPATAAEATAAVAGVAGLVSAFSKAVHVPVSTAPAK